MIKEDYKTIVSLANHYLAIGSKNIYLSSYDNEEFPWQYVTKVKKGSTFRSGMYVTIGFEALHPCGLRFNWLTDLELPGSDGSSTIKIDVQSLRQIADRIPKAAKLQLAEVLTESKNSIVSNANSYQKIADDQYTTARHLTSLINSLG